MPASRRDKIVGLLWQLRRQYPSHVATFSPCKQCAKPARGGGLCGDCLFRGLKGLGADTNKVMWLMASFGQHAKLIRHIDGVIDSIVSEAT